MRFPYLIPCLIVCAHRARKIIIEKKRDEEADEEKEISLSFHLLFHLCINLV